MTRTPPTVSTFLLGLLSLASLAPAQQNNGAASGWAHDSIWHDGLVEKAVYDASRVIYGKPRAYEAIIFTNKEQHDTKTLTKDADNGGETVEVWKHNQVEVIPTPNYDYKYETTSHLTVDGLELTRLDCSSQEFCGTSFKQYLRKWPAKSWDYWSFSYMPEAGRAAGEVKPKGDRPVVAADSLPLVLRDFDFEKKGTWPISLLPDQTNNRPTPAEPRDAEVRYAGDDGESNSHKLELHADGKRLGTYWMARDRLHVMTRYQSADGQQTYKLKDLGRVNYWTIKGE